MLWFPGHQPGSLSNVQPDSNLSVENVPFFNFSPSVKSFFFFPAVKVVVGTDFLFSAKYCCMLLLIFMMITAYQASGLM